MRRRVCRTALDAVAETGSARHLAGPRLRALFTRRRPCSAGRHCPDPNAARSRHPLRIDPCMSTLLARVATLLLVLALSAQGLSTAAQRLWAPLHYHVDPASHAAPAVPVKAWAGADHGRHAGRPEHDAMRGDAPAHRHDHMHGHAHHPGPAMATATHRHAATRAHRHEHARGDVVVVDTGVDAAPAAITHGSEQPWSIEPAHDAIALRRLDTPPPRSTPAMRACWHGMPPERPPRV